ncbi:MAG: hypothetical protein CVT80_01620 [Alphaproteobacteria bacterium HGW-Alphaproteobacteria-2]|nr:MAG: hypothetical protein CVT80_01620 [Alphaproteobacteria bacterium HGW-Alphaproteobacteria-2]
MDRKQQFHLWYFLAAFMGLLLVQSWLSHASVRQRIPYITFIEHLEAGARLLLERETITPADFPSLKPSEVTAA